MSRSNYNLWPWKNFPKRSLRLKVLGFRSHREGPIQAGEIILRLSDYGTAASNRLSTIGWHKDAYRRLRPLRSESCHRSSKSRSSCHWKKKESSLQRT